jgi:hypothetical protein
MVGEHGDVLRASQLHLQHESLHDGLSAEGECSPMMEDTPTSTKHGCRRSFIGTIQGAVSREILVRGIH